MKLLSKFKAVSITLIATSTLKHKTAEKQVLQHSCFPLTLQSSQAMTCKVLFSVADPDLWPGETPTPAHRPSLLLAWQLSPAFGGAWTASFPPLSDSKI